MKKWNYRVVRSIERLKDLKPVECLTIHTVFYDDAGNIDSWCKDPTYAVGSGDTAMVELRGDLRMFLYAIERPILNREELP